MILFKDERFTLSSAIGGALAPPFGGAFKASASTLPTDLTTVCRNPRRTSRLAPNPPGSMLQLYSRAPNRKESQFHQSPRLQLDQTDHFDPTGTLNCRILLKFPEIGPVAVQRHPDPGRRVHKGPQTGRNHDSANQIHHFFGHMCRF